MHNRSIFKGIGVAEKAVAALTTTAAFMSNDAADNGASGPSNNCSSDDRFI